MLNVSRQRAQQIETEALERLGTKLKRAGISLEDWAKRYSTPLPDQGMITFAEARRIRRIYLALYGRGSIIPTRHNRKPVVDE